MGEEDNVEQPQKKSKKTKKEKKPKKPKEAKPKKEKRSFKEESEKINKKFGDIIDDILTMDRKKATKFIIGGFILAVIFGTIAMTSRNIGNMATDWENLQDKLNDANYWSGVYGLQQYNEREAQIDLEKFLMIYQETIFGSLSRLGVNIGLVISLIGFTGYASDEEMESNMRLLSLILAGVILVTMMFTTLFTTITVSIT